jgi:hypothetical protein
MTRDEATTYVTVCVDDALAERSIDEMLDNTRLVGWQCVDSYDDGRVLGYFGVPFGADYLRKAVKTNGVYGVLTLVALLANLLNPAHGQTRTFQDPMGREVGRATSDARGNTVYYDAKGRTTGRSSTDSNGTTTLYDNMGRQIGTVRTKGR